MMVNCGYTCLTSYQELAHNDDLLMMMTEYDRDEASTTVHLLSFITNSIVIQSYSFTTVTATSVFSLTLIQLFVLFTRLLEFDLRLSSRSGIPGFSIHDSIFGHPASKIR